MADFCAVVPCESHVERVMELFVRLDARSEDILLPLRMCSRHAALFGEEPGEVPHVSLTVSIPAKAPR